MESAYNRKIQPNIRVLGSVNMTESPWDPPPAPRKSLNTLFLVWLFFLTAHASRHSLSHPSSHASSLTPPPSFSDSLPKQTLVHRRPGVRSYGDSMRAKALELQIQISKINKRPDSEEPRSFRYRNGFLQDTHVNEPNCLAQNWPNQCSDINTSCHLRKVRETKCVIRWIRLQEIRQYFNQNRGTSGEFVLYIRWENLDLQWSLCML